MVAFRDVFGTIRFADQGGKLLAAADIAGAIKSVFGEMAILQDALVIQSMRAGSALHFLAAQINLLHPNGMLKLEQGVRAKQNPVGR